MSSARQEGKLGEDDKKKEEARSKMNAMVGMPAPAKELDSDDMYRAAESGDLAVFKNLSKDQLIKVHSLRNDDDRTLLHVAGAAGHAQVVRILLEGVESTSIVNASDEEGWTPLHSAVSGGRDAVVEALLDLGADVSVINKGGRTPLHYAASKGHVEITNLLIKHGAKLNKKDKVGCTALHRAASADKAEVCEILLEEGADIEATDSMGQTPLMHATICDNRQVALLLVRYGADVDAQDKEEYTVLGRASEEFRPLLIDAAKAMLEG